MVAEGIKEASEPPGGTQQQGQPSPDQRQQLLQEQKVEQFRRRTADMYESVADKPLNVLSVRVEPRGAAGEPGAALRTRQALLDRELQRVLDAGTLREVHAALEVAVEHLRQLEVFRRIDALIDDAAGVGLRC
jgi:hypothetical protein